MHANCLHWGQSAWNVKACFLGKIKKNITNLSAETFTQKAKVHSKVSAVLTMTQLMCSISLPLSPRTPPYPTACRGGQGSAYKWLLLQPYSLINSNSYTKIWWKSSEDAERPQICWWMDRHFWISAKHPNPLKNEERNFIISCALSKSDRHP